MTRAKKIAVITIPVILIVAGIVVCVMRWQAWFGNRPEAPYTVAAEPHNILLTYGEKASGSRTISWRADTVLLPSRLELLRWQQQDTLTVEPQATLVHSRAGKAAFYQAQLTELPKGNYSYRCTTNSLSSDWTPLHISSKATAQPMQEFLVFGDVQDKEGTASTLMFEEAFQRHNDLAAVMFVGDIIERPTDQYWQIFFSSMNNVQQRIPVVAATGNHEYLKGVKKKLDPRWTHVFVNPENGPSRFLGTTYFIDFNNSRVVVLDTDALQLLSDYTTTQTWLRKVLEERKGAWKIVLMHHPVHAMGKGRQNPLIWFAFHRVLRLADVVFCGHDHNFMRLSSDGQKPAYILTNSSEKFYTPKEDITAECHASYMRFYEDVKVYADSLRIDTWNVAADSIFDSLLLSKNRQ